MRITFFSETEFETPSPVEYERPYHIRGTQMTVIFHSDTDYEVKGGEIEFDMVYDLEFAKSWKRIQP